MVEPDDILYPRTEHRTVRDSPGRWRFDPEKGCYVYLQPTHLGILWRREFAERFANAPRREEDR